MDRPAKSQDWIGVFLEHGAAVIIQVLILTQLFNFFPVVLCLLPCAVRMVNLVTELAGWPALQALGILMGHC
jgi:hypothetical protein